MPTIPSNILDILHRQGYAVVNDVHTFYPQLQRHQLAQAIREGEVEVRFFSYKTGNWVDKDDHSPGKSGVAIHLHQIAKILPTDTVEKIAKTLSLAILPDPGGDEFRALNETIDPPTTPPLSTPLTSALMTEPSSKIVESPKATPAPTPAAPKATPTPKATPAPALAPVIEEIPPSVSTVFQVEVAKVLKNEAAPFKEADDPFNPLRARLHAVLEENEWTLHQFMMEARGRDLPCPHQIVLQNFLHNKRTMSADLAARLGEVLEAMEDPSIRPMPVAAASTKPSPPRSEPRQPFLLITQEGGRLFFQGSSLRLGGFEVAEAASQFTAGMTISLQVHQDEEGEVSFTIG